MPFLSKAGTCQTDVRRFFGACTAAAHKQPSARLPNMWLSDFDTTLPAARWRRDAQPFEGVGDVYGWRFREFALRLVQFDAQFRVCANSLNIDCR